MFPSHAGKFPHALTLDRKRISWEQNENFHLPTIHDTQTMGEFNDANSSLTYLHSKHLHESTGSVHETGPIICSRGMTCEHILGLGVLSELEVASTNGASSDLTMSVESVTVSV
jgi:hypothetical protein